MVHSQHKLQTHFLDHGSFCGYKSSCGFLPKYPSHNNNSPSTRPFSSNDNSSTMYLGPRPGYLGAPRRIKRRATYEEVRRFRSSREFRTWWEEEEGRNWKINSRHPHMRGTVEYWRCAFLQGRRYTCLARLRITIAYDDRFVIVSRSRDHPHSHAAVVTPDDPNTIHTVTNMEPFEVQKATIIYIGMPRPDAAKASKTEQGQQPGTSKAEQGQKAAKSASSQEVVSVRCGTPSGGIQSVAATAPTPVLRPPSFVTEAQNPKGQSSGSSTPAATPGSSTPAPTTGSSPAAATPGSSTPAPTTGPSPAATTGPSSPAATSGSSAAAAKNGSSATPKKS